MSVPATPFPLGRPARIAVFASGRGSNFAALLGAFPPAALDPAAGGAAASATGAGSPAASSPGLPGGVALLVANRADAGALERARAAGVEAAYLPWRGPDARARFEAAALELLAARRIDLVCLAGFMRVLSPAFVAAWRGRLLNIHPSLLPAFPGLHAQRQALAAGVAESGCTVHFVDEGVDTGAPVLQTRVPVLPGDDEARLAARIRAAEHRLYPAAVRRVLAGVARPRSAPADVRAGAAGGPA